MKHRHAMLAKLLAILMAFVLVAAACGDDDGDTSPQDEPSAETGDSTESPEPEEEAAPEPEEEEAAPEPEPEPAAPDASDAAMATTQMAATEEQPKLLDITSGAGSSGLDITFGEQGPFLDQILAGSGQIDVFGALHGSFPPLARENALTNLVDLLDDLSADRSFAPSMVSAGLLGSDDNLAFIPWGSGHIHHGSEQAST